MTIMRNIIIFILVIVVAYNGYKLTQTPMTMRPDTPTITPGPTLPPLTDATRISKGDTIAVAYVAKFPDTDVVFDTTDVNVAKAVDIFNPERKYAPIKFIVGQRHVIQGIDDAVIDMVEGEQKVVVIKPEKAYGPVDPNKIVSIPRADLEKQGIPLEVGVLFKANNLQGLITDIGKENVTANFNHELAGKTLMFEIRIVKIFNETVG